MHTNLNGEKPLRSYKQTHTAKLPELGLRYLAVMPPNQRCRWSMVAALALASLAAPAQAPIQSQSFYKDAAAQATLGTAADFLYNDKPDKADSTLHLLKPKYGQHPGYMLFAALVLYWRRFPIALAGEDYKRYKEMVAKSLEAAEVMYDKDDKDPEAIFFCMMGNSILGRQAAEDNESWHAVSYARKSYSYMQEGAEYKAIYPEFYFSSGLYDYYRERYPEDHPIYRAFLAFFPSGNKQRGIEGMEVAGEKAIYTRTEALAFLTNIYLHYEAQPAKGLVYAARLAKQYPNNPQYRLLYAEALLACAKPQEALPHIKFANTFDNRFFRGGAAALYGVYQEQTGAVPDKIKASYQEALNLLGPIPKTADNLKSIAMAGQARLAAARGDHNEAKRLYHRMMGITQNTMLKNEAKQYLR